MKDLSIEHASNSIFSTELVKVRKDVSIPHVDVNGFGSALSADCHEEEVISSE